MINIHIDNKLSIIDKTVYDLISQHFTDDGYIAHIVKTLDPVIVKKFNALKRAIHNIAQEMSLPPDIVIPQIKTPLAYGLSSFFELFVFMNYTKDHSKLPLISRYDLDDVLQSLKDVHVVNYLKSWKIMKSNEYHVIELKRQHPKFFNKFLSDQKNVSVALYATLFSAWLLDYINKDKASALNLARMVDTLGEVNNSTKITRIDWILKNRFQLITIFQREDLGTFLENLFGQNYFKILIAIQMYNNVEHGPATVPSLLQRVGLYNYLKNIKSKFYNTSNKLSVDIGVSPTSEVSSVISEGLFLDTVNKYGIKGFEKGHYKYLFIYGTFNKPISEVEELKNRNGIKTINDIFFGADLEKRKPGLLEKLQNNNDVKTLADEAIVTLKQYSNKSKQFIVRSALIPYMDFNYMKNNAFILGHVSQYELNLRSLDKYFWRKFDFSGISAHKVVAIIKTIINGNTGNLKRESNKLRKKIKQFRRGL